MALSANSVWEVRVGGSGINGGGFVAGSGGTDYSQQASAQVAVTDAVTSASSGTVTSATANFTSAMVGNIVYLQGGSGSLTAGWYQVIGFTNATTITVDRNPGTSTGVTLNLGGAFNFLANALAVAVAGNKIYVGGGTYVVATTTNCSVTGAIPSNAQDFNRIIGYNTTRGDGGRPTIQLNAGSLTGLNVTTTGWEIENLIIDCNAQTSSNGIVLGANASYSHLRNCTVKNFTSYGIRCQNSASDGFGLVIDCEVTAGASGATAGLTIEGVAVDFVRLNVHDNACPGILNNVPSSVITDCLITNNTGASSDGIRTYWGTTLLNNTIHGNGRDGIRNSTQYNIGCHWKNNLITANGGYGINFPSGAVPADFMYDGNAYWNNTSGARNNADGQTGIDAVNPYTNTLDITLTGNPYVNSASGNFGLNSTVGAGAAARAAGSPGAFLGNASTTGYLDLGTVQHQDSGAGGGGTGGGQIVLVSPIGTP